MSQSPTSTGPSTMAPGFQDFIQTTAPIYPSPPVSPLEPATRGRLTDTAPISPITRSRACSVSSSPSVPNFSRVMSQRKSSVPSLPKLAGIQPVRRTPTTQRKNATIKRWDGSTRTAAQWDNLRRDAELYDQEATCAVHFHGRGRSQRGPALKVPFAVVSESGCLAALSSRRESSGSESPSSDSGYSSIGSQQDTQSLFIAAPDYLTREESLNYHITTRNIFAWMMNKPLVGYSLGQAMIDLLERLLTIRPATLDSVKDCLTYADRMGYTDMNSHPDHALAMLGFAEHFRIRDLWTNAFVHCAGMNDILYQSSELDSISKQTQASITKAYLKTDLAVTKTTRALAIFLEDELSPAHLGLTVSQRAHLDRFRSFIHSFYVGKLGYWPPPEFTKDLLAAMHRDFSSLYALLVDKDSFPNLPNATSGGLCVLQNVGAFDEWHSYTEQPHPLPLMPQYGTLDGKAFNSRGLRSFLGSRASRRELYACARSGLDAATNKVTTDMKSNSLVQSYLIFEQESILHLEPDLAISDARKVRWIMIYYTLQMLTSITASPPQFVPGGNGSVPYQACCAVPPIPWTSGRDSVLSVHPALRSQTPSERSLPSTPTDLQPDCSRDDYFSKSPTRTNNHARQDSGLSLTPQPLRISSPSLSRATSLLNRRSSLSLRTRLPNSSPKGNSHLQSPVEVDETSFSPSGSSTTDSFYLHLPHHQQSPFANEAHELPAGARTPTLELEDMLALTSFPAAPKGPFELDATEAGSGAWLDDASSQATDDVSGAGKMCFEIDLGFDFGSPSSKGAGEVEVCWEGIYEAYSQSGDDDGGASLAGSGGEEEGGDGGGDGDGDEGGNGRMSCSSGDSVTSAYSDFYAGSEGSQATANTGLTPVVESPGTVSLGGSARWAGDYRECLGDGYFSRLEGREEELGVMDRGDEEGVWVDVPRR
ncbi:hypothetical protein BDZ85DRAFT_294828 [Elsinoe ampelina]|uniref:DUF8004 domain-containing protein n=1 Tax=Elsinoe ampelina TaxID=302913 RepID=A0A6A6GHR9_9PEZI|nr:hypothetical protein BDZ85DRAFT_294828 [Elsinoe ampelina]